MSSGNRLKGNDLRGWPPALPTRKRLAFIAFAAFAASASGGVVAEAVPPGASEVIARVNHAAAQRDYVALRADMIQEFRWSFGGDASAEQAIAEWKQRPEYVTRLGKVTKAKCAYRKDKTVECPSSAGASFRAGFASSEGRWKMVYFIGGD